MLFLSPNYMSQCDKCGKQKITQEDSLKFYKGEGYGEINDYLHGRQKPQENTLKHISNIDSVLSNEPHLRQVYYRGIRGTIRIKNKSIINTGYSSVSKEFDIAQREFAGKDGCCVLAFTIPHSIKYYEYQSDTNEGELLIERNIKFIITGRDVNNPDILKAYIEKYTHPPPPKPVKKTLNDLRKEHAQMAIDADDDLSD
jgi:hypothetical protein